ncbi:MAG: Gfo/Idh/MocA family oxidoreductase [Clostridia bacterium]|nr:Gfo/Idh/MocA family oxidoreductase [Clostridia bacterium]
MGKLRVGIIGSGGISNAHTKGYLQLKDRVELVACCDIDEEKAKRYAEHYGIPTYYTDYNEMLAKENLDCVSVSTWNSAHKGATIAALNAGVNVLCEKPMAMNAEEALEMQAAAEKNGKLLQVGFVRRFGDDTYTIQRFTEEGKIGDIYYAKAQYLRRNGCPGGWFGDKSYSGGGPLIDLGVHVIDLTRYLAGSPKPVSAFAVTYDNLGCNRASGAQMQWEMSSSKEGYEYSVEDFASALIKFEGGFTLQIEASFNLNIENDIGQVELFGTKAGVKIANDLQLFTDEAGMFVNVKPQGRTMFDFDGAFNGEIRGFIDAVEGKAPCRATAEDGVILMKILDAVYESARTGKLVEIK